MHERQSSAKVSRGRLDLAVGALFFSSGFAGLVYQVLWMRELGLLFGSTAHAAATTAAAFFLGLGAGSACFGEKRGLSARPLRTYGWLELAVSVAALLHFGLLPAYRAVYPALFGALGDRPGLFLGVKFCLALAALFPAAFFMGGTLPVISRHLTRGREAAALGSRVPLFYGINTLGAAAGALAAGFFLPRWLGMTGSYWLAVGVTTGAGLLALALSRRAPESEAGAGDRPPPRPGPLVLPRAATGLAFFSGFSALALEVLWTRMFAQSLHNSVYTYSVILVIFLAGLAAGSWVAGWLARRAGGEPEAALPWLLLAAGAAVLATPMLFYFAGSNRGGYLGGSENWPAYLRLVFTAAGATIFPAAVALGVVFPYLLKCCEAAAEQGGAGRVVGRLAAVNVGGAVLGSLAGGFLLLDWLGLWGSIRLFAVAYLVLVFFFAPWRRRGGEVSRTPDAALGAALALVGGLALADPARLPVVSVDPAGRGEVLLDLREGSAATVAVVRRGDSLRIKLNNSYTLGSTGAARHERFQAELPLAMHPAPRRVFFLGLGTGITAGAALKVEGVEQVRACELFPDVIRASRLYFRPWLNGLHEDPRAQVVAEDGRNYLAGTRETYDVIISDLFIPWRAGVGNLYTREHYAAAARRLAPGGIYAQWLPLYQLTERDFASIARTMGEVFPRVQVWRGDFLSDRPIVCLAGASDPGPLDWERFRERSAGLPMPPGAEELAAARGLPLHLACYAGDFTASGLHAGARINADAYPHIEYDAPVAHRAQRAGEARWFTGGDLAGFFAALVEALPPGEDPWLAGAPEAGRLLVEAGAALHLRAVARAEGQSGLEEEAGARLAALLAELGEGEDAD